MYWNRVCLNFNIGTLILKVLECLNSSLKCLHPALPIPAHKQSLSAPLECLGFTREMSNDSKITSGHRSCNMNTFMSHIAVKVVNGRQFFSSNISCSANISFTFCVSEKKMKD